MTVLIHNRNRSMTPLDTSDADRFATLVVTTCACGCGATVTISEAYDTKPREFMRRSLGKRLPELRGWSLGRIEEPDPKRPGKVRSRQQVLCPACTKKLQAEARALGRWEKRYGTFLQALITRMKKDVKGVRRAEVVAWFQANPPPQNRERYGVEDACATAIHQALSTHLEAIASPAVIA